MGASKSIVLSLAVLVALATTIMLIKVLLRKAKNKNSEDGRIKLSFGIWSTTLFLSCSLIITKAISLLSMAVDNIYKIAPAKIIPESFKEGSLFIGLSLTWLLLWYYIVNILSVLVTGKRSEAREVDTDNYVFFLISGILLIGFIICLLPAFEIILRVFIPSVDMSFYH